MTIPKYRAFHKQRKIMLPVLELNLDPEHGGVFVESNDGSYCGCRLHMEMWPWADIELIEQAQELPNNNQSPDEQEIQRILAVNPVLANRITWLVNAYRELAKTAISEMEDKADCHKSLAKKDNVARRLGLTLLDTNEDWQQFRLEH